MDTQQLLKQAYLDSLPLWNSAPTAFCVVRSLGADDFEWVYANAALCEDFDQPAGSMQGKTFRALFPSGSASWPELVASTVSSGVGRSVTQHSHVLQKTLFCKTYCPVPGLCACFVQDVSARVRMAQKTEAAQKRLGLILQNTTDSVFDFDLATHTLYSSADAVERYGALAVIPDAPNTMFMNSLIREAGALAFCTAISALEKGAQEQSFELELRFHPDMAMMWYSMQLLCYTDMLTRRPAVIGYVRNIDQQRRQHDRLREAAERDSLTGLYNRGAAEIRMIPSLRQEQRFAFFVFDVDNFKRMNDTQGHAFGDAMLLCFAQALRGSFRQDELVWRHGGDEFCACVFGRLSHDVLEKRCRQVLEHFARVTSSGGAARMAAQVAGRPCVPLGGGSTEMGGRAANSSCADTNGCTANSIGMNEPATACAAQGLAHESLTCSIGVAYGTGPKDYAVCFAAADAALFETKQNGKNGFTVVEMR